MPFSHLTPRTNPRTRDTKFYRAAAVKEYNSCAYAFKLKTQKKQVFLNPVTNELPIPFSLMSSGPLDISLRSFSPPSLPGQLLLLYQFPLQTALLSRKSALTRGRAYTRGYSPMSMTIYVCYELSCVLSLKFLCGSLDSQCDCIWR